jgi:hypothetical protein
MTFVEFLCFLYILIHINYLLITKLLQANQWLNAFPCCLNLTFHFYIKNKKKTRGFINILNFRTDYITILSFDDLYL